MHYMQEEGIQYSVGNINMIFLEANKDSWLVLRRTIPSNASQGNCCNIRSGMYNKKETLLWIDEQNLVNQNNCNTKN